MTARSACAFPRRAFRVKSEDKDMQNDIFSSLPSGSLFTVSWRGSRRPERRGADPAHALDMGEMYYFGQGAEQNLAEAAKWFRKAAEEGDPEAAGYLGEMYYLGRGVRQDFKEALKWCL